MKNINWKGLKKTALILGSAALLIILFTRFIKCGKQPPTSPDQAIQELKQVRTELRTAGDQLDCLRSDLAERDRLYQLKLGQQDKLLRTAQERIERNIDLTKSTKSRVFELNQQHMAVQKRKQQLAQAAAKLKLPVPIKE